MLAPLLMRGMRKWGRDVGITAAASRSWVVEGPSTTHHRPALYDPADLEKVTAPPPGSTMPYQLDRLTRHTTPHPSLQAHLLTDVVLVDGCLIKWNLLNQLFDGPVPRRVRRPTLEIAQAALATSYLGNKFFGHWLLDDMPLAMLGEAVAPRIGTLGHGRALTDHQSRYLPMFGQSIRYLDSAFFRELVVFDYCTESADKARRYARMKDCVRGGAARRDHAGVMLLRKASGQPRVLVNEMEIAGRMAARGLRVVDPLTTPLDEVIAACLDARVLVGCEGSHLAHAFLPMRSDGVVLTLQPPFKFDHFWRDRMNSVGGGYACVVGDAVEGGFQVDADAVERMLDRLPTPP